ncbi:MAG: hypothetical protein HY544_00350 [Candidatus Diapherotrites archaeon]|uniref:Uncharacterized protein n=1 Tax=Candidatus Iainarchaeum sp. TaxID=3101447 RepID=A0A8T3YI55_9ARCH|nr:hypothetical protein [Candidatus Diapherotrites archaeon]
MKAVRAILAAVAFEVPTRVNSLAKSRSHDKLRLHMLINFAPFIKNFLDLIAGAKGCRMVIVWLALCPSLHFSASQWPPLSGPMRFIVISYIVVSTAAGNSPKNGKELLAVQ